MLPTIDRSGASSSPDATADGQFSVTAAGGDGWAPTSETAAATSSSGGAVDGPTITFESANGHQIVLTYQDIVLFALLAGAGAAAWRGMQWG